MSTPNERSAVTTWANCREKGRSTSATDTEISNTNAEPEGTDVGTRQLPSNVVVFFDTPLQEILITTNSRNYLIEQEGNNMRKIVILAIFRSKSDVCETSSTNKACHTRLLMTKELRTAHGTQQGCLARTGGVGKHHNDCEAVKSSDNRLLQFNQISKETVGGAI